MLKVNKADDSKSLLQLSEMINEAIRNFKISELESSVLSDLMIVSFMLTKLDNSVKQHWELSLQDKQTIPDLDMLHAFIEKEMSSLGHTNKMESK